MHADTVFSSCCVLLVSGAFAVACGAGSEAQSPDTGTPADGALDVEEDTSRYAKCEATVPNWTAEACRAVRLVGTPGHDVASDLAIDDDGLVYVVGTTRRSTRSGDAGSNADASTSTQRRTSYGFIAKYDVAGSLLWMERIEASGRVTADAVSIGPDGNLYVAGSTGASIESASYNGGPSDGYVAKFDPVGTLSWVRMVGGPGSDHTHDVDVGNGGELYAGGVTEQPSGSQGGSSGKPDGFLARFAAGGSNDWTRRIGTDSVQDIRGVTVDSEGIVHATGRTAGELDGRSFNGGSFDAFLTAYDDTGSRVFTRLIGSDGTDAGRAIAAARDGSLYVSGATDGSLGGKRSPGGAQDAFVVSFDGRTSGWARLLGSSGKEAPHRIAVGPDGALLMAGGTTTGFGSNTSYRGGPIDGYVASLAPSGESLNWVQLIGAGGREWAASVAATDEGWIYAVGQTDGGFGGRNYNGGERDAFVTVVRDGS